MKQFISIACMCLCLLSDDDGMRVAFTQRSVRNNLVESRRVAQWGLRNGGQYNYMYEKNLCVHVWS